VGRAPADTTAPSRYDNGLAGKQSGPKHGSVGHDVSQSDQRKPPFRRSYLNSWRLLNVNVNVKNGWVDCSPVLTPAFTLAFAIAFTGARGYVMP